MRKRKKKPKTLAVTRVRQAARTVIGSPPAVRRFEDRRRESSRHRQRLKEEWFAESDLA